MKDGKIRDLPKTLRPREKLKKYGPEKLTNSELLAIILRTGRKGENVVQLASKILRKFGAENLPYLGYEDLMNFKGLGDAKICQIIACFELGKRLLKDKKVKVFLSPQEIFDEMRDIRDNKKEHFVIFYLDSRKQEIKREIISVGTLTASLVHPREVFEPAIRNFAVSIIISHNHPSGNPEPSREDIEITNRLIEAGKILGIEVDDHVIVTKHRYFSFKEKGLI